MKNMIYDIDGVSKDFLSWCKEFNQRPEIVQSRMSLGLALDEALRVATSNKELLFNILESEKFLVSKRDKNS